RSLRPTRRSSRGRYAPAPLAMAIVPLVRHHPRRWCGVTLRLAQIRDLAYRFVPPAAADDRLYNYGPRSWWPAHEIGHFLVATKAECHLYMYGLDNFIKSTCTPSQYHYVVAREIAATSISQRMLRRAGHVAIADEEIEYTDEDTIECSYERWCKRAVRGLLRRNRVLHLPTSYVHID